jgi:predicted transcriptional regulator
MGHGGKYIEQARARELRAESWTLNEIAAELGVSKSSVSVWVRDVDFVPRPRNRGHPAGPQHPMRVRKEAEIERCREEAEAIIGELTDRDLTMFALAL